jgi:periplasmic protein TonB
MKRDVPLYWTFILAVVLHTLIAVTLKYTAAQVPPPRPAPAAPLAVRLVDVPKTQEKREMPALGGTPRQSSAPAVAPQPRPVAPAPRPAPPPVREQAQVRNNVQPAPAQRENQPLPKIQTPDSVPSRSGSLPSNPEPLRQADLEKALKNLDRYISPGTGSNEGSPVGGSPGGNGGSGGGPMADSGAGAYFDTQGYDLGPWGDRVVAITKKNWVIPEAANLGVKGVVSIAFDVSKNGTIMNIRIIGPSGVPSFDRAAVNALSSSNPFPPLPLDFPRPILPAVFRFFYNVPVP